MIPPQLLSKIKLVAPGMPLRQSLDEIAKASFGSLMVFLDDLDSHSSLFQGGFDINCEFSSQKLYELAKMDGAIIINENISKIFKANVHLVPDASILTNETGMRHRTAERVARQTHKLTIAISRRRNVITVYLSNFKHPLNDLNYLITKVNLALSTLEKSTEKFDQLIYDLTFDELESQVRLSDVIRVILKAQEIMKITQEIEPYVVESGTEGHFSSQQLNRSTSYIRNLLSVFVMDYSAHELKDHEVSYILKTIKKLSEFDKLVIAKMLGWNLMSETELNDIYISPRCYRLLTKVAVIPMSVARNVMKIFNNISELKTADSSALQKIEGVGEKRAHDIIRGVQTLQTRVRYT